MTRAVKTVILMFFQNKDLARLRLDLRNVTDCKGNHETLTNTELIRHGSKLPQHSNFPFY